MISAMTSRFQTPGERGAPDRADKARPGGEVSAMEPEVSAMEPEVSSAEPEVSPMKSEASPVEPGLSPVEPGVPSAEPENEDFWAPFLAYRPGDRRAERLRAHAREDAKRGQRHPPRRAAALSREEIVRAAMNVADAEGADAINMRRIARELHSGTMSLYWHIRSKEELLDLMIDAIIGEPAVPERSGDWRADLRAIACGTRDSLHRHQWAVNFMGGRPPLGPKSLRNLDRSLGVFDGLGL